MASHTDQRTLVITFKAPHGLSRRAANELAERVKAIVSDDYQMCVHEVIGSARLNVGPYGKKGDRLQSIANMPPDMTAGDIAQALGINERQVYRYRALLRQLSDT